MPDDADLPRRVTRKVALRTLPLLFALYVVAYLDRANVGFAKLRMSDALGFDEAVFGLGVGLFFVGYLVLEIPGALLVERWSARKWFARILVTWGFCSMGMAYVTTPTEFYVLRFLLGLAEAGFFPGVIVYFTHWFPRAERARALTGMLVGIPISLALGAVVSRWLLDQGWLGYAGWQWVFLAEGAPAVLLGIAVPFLLTDRPRQAKWLTAEERDWLEATLAAEREATPAANAMRVRDALKLRTVWLLALGIFCTNLGGYAFVFWLPTAVKGLLAGLGQDAADTTVLGWTCVVYLCGIAGVVTSGFVSDLTGNRKWPTTIGQLGTGLFLALSTVPDQSWSAVFAWLCCAGFFAHFWYTPFWVLPTLSLTASAAAVAIGFINMWANLAGFAGSWAVGELRVAGLGDRGCLLILACTFAAGAAFVAAVPVQRPDPPGSADEW
ncbi:MFS transporter [Urbifossiella limnaea]|uniref:Tartrate transporter n=1 Tax=Urbifossiella limnaea TaxID=2528023 RepID=A0A517XMB3_9BACT|nr:MFS transporter [Urbifossiella limnaea]QDU18616.1 Putative tartrate transporter [Urbifossiella limnaea]